MEKKSPYNRSRIDLVNAYRLGHHRRLEGNMFDQIGCLDERLKPRIGRRWRRNVCRLRDPRTKLVGLGRGDVVIRRRRRS
jgi:hypothetical protein